MTIRLPHPLLNPDKISDTTVAFSMCKAVPDLVDEVGGLGGGGEQVQQPSKAASPSLLAQGGGGRKWPPLDIW